MSSPGGLIPIRGSERGLLRHVKTGLATGPDFTDITKAFTNLSSNPSLFARGGTWVDPTQAQQEATPGYLQQRGQIATENIQNKVGLADLANQLGKGMSGITALLTQLQAAETGSQTGMFGLLGGLI